MWFGMSSLRSCTCHVYLFFPNLKQPKGKETKTQICPHFVLTSVFWRTLKEREKGRGWIHAQTCRTHVSARSHARFPATPEAPSSTWQRAEETTCSSVSPAPCSSSVSLPVCVPASVADQSSAATAQWWSRADTLFTSPGLLNWQPDERVRTLWPDNDRRGLYWSGIGWRTEF